MIVLIVIGDGEKGEDQVLQVTEFIGYGAALARRCDAVDCRIFIPKSREEICTKEISSFKASESKNLKVITFYDVKDLRVS